MSVLHYGQNSAPYSTRPNENLAGKVRIHVHPNGSIEVEHPTALNDQDDIRLAVQKRAGWVFEQLNRHEENHRYARPRTYVSGETHFYLGRRYMLKVSKKEGGTVVRLKGRFLEVKIDEIVGVPDALNHWYRARAAAYFEKRLAELTQGLPWLESTPQIKMKSMSKKWGACSPSGYIILNPKLVRAERMSVDYVLLHELCHLKENNHSPKFFKLMDRHMPNWKARRRRLEEKSELYLAS